MEIIKITADEIAKTHDLQVFFEKLRKRNKKILINYYNFLSEKATNLINPNWLDENDLRNLLNLTDFEIIGSIKGLGVSTMTARPKVYQRKEYSVSIIVPARNEEGNIKKIVSSIPKFGKWQEIIFIEGGSKDNTWEEIVKSTSQKTRATLKLRRARQKGKGKANAVRLGFSKAKGEVLMIYDADCTVPSSDLPKFYNAIASGKGEFINGSRLVYPMEKDAMQFLNKIGNKVFSILFSYILGQRFKDTLCGTKVFLKKDYLNFKKFREDPFGDFELIFGAIQNNLKVIEIPVRYKERVYGKTNIQRFWHGLLLAKMVWKAFKIFRFK